MSHDVTKLPKWAQSRIQTAERNVADLQRDAVAMHDGESEVVIERYGEDSIYLPPETTITFHVYGGKVDVSVRDEKLTVMGRVMGRGQSMSDGLLIQPSSSNVVYVTLAPWEMYR